MRTSTNSNTEQKAVEAAPVEQTKPSPQGEDVQFLPNVDTLLENPVKQWYKEYNFIDPTYNDQDPTEQDKIKLQRKSIGIRVSVRPTTIDSGTKKSLEEDNVVFSLDKCPPPLPTNFFQILKERMKHTNIIDDIDPTSTVAKHDNHKEISSAVQHVSQLLYQVHIQSKGKIDQPTPVQLQTWPILLSGKCKNVLVVAPTGSGKTLCYGVGIVQFCLNAILKETNNRVSSSINFRVEDGPMALIVSPTRELANQICHNLKQVANCANAILRHNHCHQPSSAKARRTAPKVRIIPIYGGDGMSRNEQLAYFDPGEPMIHIVAATPGRLLDLLGIGDQTKDRPNASSAKNLSLKNVSWFVIDEADKMLQLGFREQIDIISSKIRKDRMTVQLSATFPERLSKACNSWLGTGTLSDENNNLIVVKSSTIQIGINEQNRPKATSGASNDLLSTDEKLAKPPEELANNETREFGEENRLTEISMIPSHIAQILHVCSTHKKPKKLLGILCKLREAERESGRTRHQGLLVVFFSKIKTLQFISKLLKKEAVAKCTELHGQLKQWEREGALNDFKSGKVSVLLSTDVAARGIHVNNIRYIINYDFPTSIEQVSSSISHSFNASENIFFFGTFTFQ